MRLGERVLALKTPHIEGPDVVAWQRIIETHPILGTPRLQVTGVFDELTDAVTRIWQGERHLTVDGVVGAVTLLEARATANVFGDAMLEMPVPPRQDVEDILARRRLDAEARVKADEGETQ